MNALDWELEISKRYAQPLFSESNEFPDAETIQKRMVPICYQEGLEGGCTNGCSDLVNVATEAFIKEQLADLFRRVRSNGPNYIKTSRFRRRLEREEDRARKGEIKRDAYTLLPVEAEVETKRKPFGREDLRLATLLGNSYVSQSKIIAARILDAPHIEYEDETTAVEDEKPNINGIPPQQKSNGIHIAGANGGMMVNGLNGHRDEDIAMMDENDWGWSGGLAMERGALDAVLDDVLTIGS
jgi:transcriptional coactivator HFI1/ADA1